MRGLEKCQFLLYPRNRAVTVMTEDRTNWAPTRGPGPLCSYGILIIIREEVSLPGATTNSCSLFPWGSNALDSLRDMVWADFTCPEACVLIISDNSLLDSPRIGTSLPAFSFRVSRQTVRLVYTLAPTDKSPIWGMPMQIRTCPKAELTGPPRKVLQVSGLGKAVKMHHFKITVFSSKSSQNEIWERRTWLGWTAQVLW